MQKISNRKSLLGACLCAGLLMVGGEAVANNEDGKAKSATMADKCPEMPEKYDFDVAADIAACLSALSKVEDARALLIGKEIARTKAENDLKDERGNKQSSSKKVDKKAQSEEAAAARKVASAPNSNNRSRLSEAAPSAPEKLPSVWFISASNGGAFQAALRYEDGRVIQVSEGGKFQGWAVKTVDETSVVVTKGLEVRTLTVIGG